MPNVTETELIHYSRTKDVSVGHYQLTTEVQCGRATANPLACAKAPWRGCNLVTERESPEYIVVAAYVMIDPRIPPVIVEAVWDLIEVVLALSSRGALVR